MLIAHSVGTGSGIVELLKNAGLATSNSHARRLLSGKAVRINGKQIDETWTYTPVEEEQILQVGKKKISNFRRLDE
jgi:tyrosyl-tRNA synthetase